MGKLSSALPQNLRGLARKLRFAWRNAPFKQYVIHNRNMGGAQFDFLIGDIDGHEWYGDVERLSPEMAFLRETMVQPEDVVFDCGAHHGFLTILLASWAGLGGRVIAFEASPSSARILAKNISGNRLEDRVTVEPKAVGATAGVMHFSEESNAIALKGDHPGGTIVPVVPLDDYLPLQPDLIKLDVEGCEIEALAGAARVLEHRPKLAIEVHVDMIASRGRKAIELFEHVRAEHYDFWLQPGVHETPRPYDGENLDELHMNQLHLYALPRTGTSITALKSSS